MQRWLARLSFSFFIIAAVLLWEAYKGATGSRGPVPEWRIITYCIVAVMAVVLGAMGVRARHQSEDQ